MSLAFVLWAMAAQADGPQLTAPTSQAAVIAFNPPVNRPLSIDISDDRLLPDGHRVRFVAHYRLTFAVDGQGWLAALLTLAPDCDGPPHLCQAFRSALLPLTGRERRALIGRDGAVTAMSGPQASGDLVGDDAVRDAIDTARAGGSDIAAAEIIEALAYVGMPIASSDDDHDVVVSADHIDVREPMQLPGGPGAPPMTIQKISRIDRATGLVTASDIDVHGSGQPLTLISRRQWRLRQVDAVVP